MPLFMHKGYLLFCLLMSHAAFAHRYGDNKAQFNPLAVAILLLIGFTGMKVLEWLYKRRKR